jgi:hypothetical protein
VGRIVVGFWRAPSGVAAILPDAMDTYRGVRCNMMMTGRLTELSTLEFRKNLLLDCTSVEHRTLLSSRKKSWKS